MSVKVGICWIGILHSLLSQKLHILQEAEMPKKILAISFHSQFPCLTPFPLPTFPSWVGWKTKVPNLGLS